MSSMHKLIILNILKKLYYSLWLLLNWPILALNDVRFDRSVKIRGFIYIKNKGLFLIGKNVKINSSQKSNPIGGGSLCFFQILNQGKIQIGDGVRMSNISITAASSVTIGADTFIGSGVGIFDTDFHSLNWNERINKDKIKENIKVDSIDIGKKVFIGTRTLVLKGVTIGDESIIGAGSVVTKNIPSGQIWAGNPAKFLKNI